MSDNAFPTNPTIRRIHAEQWDAMVIDAIRRGVTTDARLHPNPYRTERNHA